jgi:hypothetical protein
MKAMGFGQRGRTARRLSSVGAGFIVAAGIFFAVMPVAQASASSGTTCGYGDSGGNTQTCLTVGNGFVSTSASVVNGGSGRTLQSCLHITGNPAGCTAFTYVPPGGGIGTSVTYGGGVPSGTYCSVTWRANTDGTTSQIGDNCQGVTVIG